MQGRRSGNSLAAWIEGGKEGGGSEDEIEGKQGKKRVNYRGKSVESAEPLTAKHRGAERIWGGLIKQVKHEERKEVE